MKSDNAVLQQLNQRGLSVNDLALYAGLRRGTVVAALRRLEEKGQARREWHGNARFGRYLHFRP